MLQCSSTGYGNHARPPRADLTSDFTDFGTLKFDGKWNDFRAVVMSLCGNTPVWTRILNGSSDAPNDDTLRSMYSAFALRTCEGILNASIGYYGPRCPVNSRPHEADFGAAAICDWQQPHKSYFAIEGIAVKTDTAGVLPILAGLFCPRDNGHLSPTENLHADSAAAAAAYFAATSVFDIKLLLAQMKSIIDDALPWYVGVPYSRQTDDMKSHFDYWRDWKMNKILQNPCGN